MRIRSLTLTAERRRGQRTFAVSRRSPRALTTQESKSILFRRNSHFPVHNSQLLFQRAALVKVAETTISRSDSTWTLPHCGASGHLTSRRDQSCHRG